MITTHHHISIVIINILINHGPQQHPRHRIITVAMAVMIFILVVLITSMIAFDAYYDRASSQSLTNWCRNCTDVVYSFILLPGIPGGMLAACKASGAQTHPLILVDRFTSCDPKQ